MNLANKYRPKEFTEVVEQSIVTTMLKKMCESKDLDCRNFLLIGSAGIGKAQPLNSKILTTKGFIEMKDVEIGTSVFTHTGEIGKVSGIYPQGIRPIYEITLQDRTSIRVSDEHLNVVYRYNEDTKQREDFCLTTVDLIQLFNTSRFKLRIDIPSVDWKHNELPVDPYLLGALIGDGSLSNNFEFSNPEEDVVEKVDTILRRDWNLCLKKIPGDNVDYSIVSTLPIHKYQFIYQGEVYHGCYNMAKRLHEDSYPLFDNETIVRICEGVASNVNIKYPELQNNLQMKISEEYKYQSDRYELKQVLNDLGLLCKSCDKHIPEMYLYSDKDSRIALLQGLFDTDGYTDKNGVTVFTTCSNNLSNDFAFLVRSLGIRDTVVEHPSRYKCGDSVVYTGSTAYDHNLKVSWDLVYCSSEKHMNRRIKRQNDPMRNIVSIKYVGDEECQCIMVDHPDHTYISDGFIPTHNTTLGRIMASTINEGKGEPIEIDAASNGGVENVREIVQQARLYPVGCEWKVFIIDECHSLSNTAWQALLKTLEEGPAKSVFVLCTTNAEKIPATILSRVQTFQLSKISLKGIHDRLVHVIECENREGRNIQYQDDAVNYIAKLANGGMRDAMTLLDKALSYSTEITSENLSKALNLPNYDDYFALLSAYAKKDNQAVAAIIHFVYNSGVNFVKWFEGFHAFVINVVKYIFLQNIDATMIPSHYLDKISKYTTAHASICLKLANKLLKMNQELRTTSYLQEVTLTYLCSISKKGE